jgi:hypothetical protein
MLPNLQLRKISHRKLESLILSVYKQMMTSYLAEKALIQESNLVEVAFDDLERDPMSTIKSIYESLEIDGFEKSKPSINEYIESKKGYKKNTHTITKKKLERILTEWDFAMKEWNYSIPDNVKIIK